MSNEKSRSSWKTVAVVGGLLWAVASGSHALGSYLETKSPAAALGTFPENGRIYVEAGDEVLRQAIIANDGALPEVIPNRALQLARRGLASEPLAVEGYRILALGMAADGEGDDATSLMRLAVNLSRRESGTSIWLSQDYAQRGDLPSALGAFDRMLRASNSSRALVLPAMVQALSQDDAIEAFAGLLESSPPWEADFWREAVRQRQLGPRVAELRQRLGRGYEVDPAIDQRILTTLVDLGNYSEAGRFYAALSGEQPKSTFVSTFDAAPAYPPFDWALTSDGEYGADIVTDRAILLASAVNGASGVVARRLLQGEPGQYRLSFDDVTLSSPRAELSVLTRCAGQEESQSVPLQESDGTLTARWTISAGNCDFFWLELRLAVPADANPTDVSIGQIALERDGS